MMSDTLITAAAESNARWCHSMAAAHGLSGSFGAHAWTCPSRMPRYFPDAVTTSPAAETDETLERVDNSPGCSVKDSFNLLDLSRKGFGELLSGEWIYRPDSGAAPATKPDEHWRPVRDDDELSEWEARFTDDDEPAHRLFPATLLNDPQLTIVAGYTAAGLIGGAMLHRHADGIQVSNVFNLRADTASSWAGVLRVADVIGSRLPLFGWEHGPYLDPALGCGFTAIGPLRVWWRQA